jgi:hypothetical protein
LLERVVSSKYSKAHTVSACEIAAGERPPRDEAPSDPDSSDDELELEDIAKNDPVEPLTTELQQLFEDVVVCVDCLYKLSMTIRNAAPHDRLIKAASIDTTYYEIWDIQHVKTKYPAAKVCMVPLCRSSSLML